jgi:hypothetical protein
MENPIEYFPTFAATEFQKIISTVATVQSLNAVFVGKKFDYHGKSFTINEIVEVYTSVSELDCQYIVLEFKARVTDVSIGEEQWYVFMGDESYMQNSQHDDITLQMGMFSENDIDDDGDDENVSP